MKDTRTPQDVWNGVPPPEYSSKVRDQHPAFRFFWGVAWTFAAFGVYMFVANTNWRTYFSHGIVYTESRPDLVPVKDYDALMERWKKRVKEQPKKNEVTIGPVDEGPVPPPSTLGDFGLDS